MSAGSLLRMDGAVVAVGEARLLDGVTLSIAPGRIVAVVGPNGAGKTTLLDAISAQMPLAGGSVTVAGVPCVYRPGRRPAGVGRVFQGSPLPDTLTVAEVTELVARGRDSAEALMARFGLAPHATSFVAELSTGMRRILDLAVATAGSPSLLLLDEPASGLAQAEIDHLAGILRRWRDETGGSIVIVEHDASLVRAVADEVLVLEAGRVAALGEADEMLAEGNRVQVRPRMRDADDERFGAAVGRVAEEAEPPTPLIRRTLSTWTLLRLGLREFAAGMGSVMIIGVLNRVMKVELGISLGVVTAILALYNLAAPFALAIGHRSDTRPIFGRRRAPYIIGGSVVTGLMVLAAPHIAGRLGHSLTVGSVLVAIVLFVAMGIGMYGSGTVFFALLADLSPGGDRAHAASIVYFELLAGILVGAGLAGALIENDAHGLPDGVSTLFALVGVLIVVLTTVAVWGLEKRAIPEARPASTRPAGGSGEGLRGAVRTIASMRQARVFFGFMVAGTLFMFLQQAVLEPFGGDVLGMSVRQTSAFKAMMTVGTIAGMVIAGRPYAEKRGHRSVARAGLIVSTIGFAALAAGAAAEATPPVWLAILAVGLGIGIFNVATLALMMGMADRRRTALFMGAWTLAHAIADGAATAGGGLIYEVARALSGSISSGYAAVFAIEAIGMAACIRLLRRVDPKRFAEEAAALDTPALVVEQPTVEEAPADTPAPAAAAPPAGPQVASNGAPPNGSRAAKPSPRRTPATAKPASKKAPARKPAPSRRPR